MLHNNPTSYERECIYTQPQVNDYYSLLLFPEGSVPCGFISGECLKNKKVNVSTFKKILFST